MAKDVGVNLKSKESRAQSRQACSKTLELGDSIVIFPEGTRQKDPPNMGTVKKGCFEIAKVCF